MQAGIAWKPPEGTLGTLVRAAERRVAELVSRRKSLEEMAAAVGVVPSLRDALRVTAVRGTVAVVAEVKRASPSKGDVNPHMDAATQAAAFAEGGAAAVSVLTEPDSFRGSPEDLLRARRVVSLPLLKKDFHIDPIQALEARAIGASALLLIARALGPQGLRTMAVASQDQGIEFVVEVRDEAELEWALAIDARIVGVNNRNLETLVIDTQAGERIIPLIPSDRTAIAESGIRSVADARAAAALGADAILVGSSLSSAADPAAAVAALAGVGHVGRGS